MPINATGPTACVYNGNNFVNYQQKKKIDDIPVFIKYDTIIYVFIDYTWNSLEPAYKKTQSYFIRPAILLLEFLMFF